MIEAKWFNNNYVPTTEEYIHTSAISCTYPLLTTISCIGMGDIATEDIFRWATSGPKIVKASSIICRLMDDIVSNEVHVYLQRINTKIRTACIIKGVFISAFFLDKK